MKVGFTMDLRNPANEPWRQFWEDRLWLYAEAEAMGFDSLLVQEHWFTRDGYAPSALVFLTLLAERTRRTRIGSHIQVLPLHHAARLAQEMAVLDHLSDGRLDVGVGGGHRPLEYSAFGISPKTRPSRMGEGLEVLRLAWTQRPFTFHGRYYDLENITVRPEPLQLPHPPLWVAATGRAAAERAGRIGANLHGASVDPYVYEAYRGSLREAGIDPATKRISNPWAMTVTDHPDKLWERNKQRYIDKWDFYRQIRLEMGDQELFYGLPPQADAYRNHELMGDAETILSTISELAASFGLTDIIHSGPVGGISIREEAYPDLRRFADEVLPGLKAL